MVKVKNRQTKENKTNKQTETKGNVDRDLEQPET